MPAEHTAPDNGQDLESYLRGHEFQIIVDGRSKKGDRFHTAREDGEDTGTIVRHEETQRLIIIGVQDTDHFVDLPPRIAGVDVVTRINLERLIRLDSGS